MLGGGAVVFVHAIHVFVCLLNHIPRVKANSQITGTERLQSSVFRQHLLFTPYSNPGLFMAAIHFWSLVLSLAKVSLHICAFFFFFFAILSRSYTHLVQQGDELCV